jgi:hypothetical protein
LVKAGIIIFPNSLGRRICGSLRDTQVYLIDHAELCFEVVNPMEPNATIGLVNLKDPSFALELESQFRKYWEQAESFTPGQ